MSDDENDSSSGQAFNDFQLLVRGRVCWVDEWLTCILMALSTSSQPRKD